MVFLLIACTESIKDSAIDVPWIEVTQWRQASLDSDLFPDHQPEEINCPVTAFLIEADQLEIETDNCNYALLEWQTQHRLSSQTTLKALVLHTGLWAPEEGNAHFALSVGGELFWEEFPPIPSNTEFFFHEMVWSKAVPKGTTVQLHLHNHGAND